MNENEMSMEELLSQYDLKTLRQGDIVKGKILKVSDEYVLVNINYMKDGIILRDDLCEENESIREFIKEDDEIDVMILSFDDGEGNVLLSKKEADNIKTMKDIKKSFEKKEAIDVYIKEMVKGGLIGLYKGISVFIPGSQASIHRVELKDLIGKSYSCEIMELDLNKNKIVASIKAIEKRVNEEKKQVLWNSLVKGEKRQGVVVRLAKFGAFVDLGGAEGLIHISELSWKRVLKPEEVVSVGDKVNVYVLDFDKDKNRISLGLKDVEEDPWNKVVDNIKVNDVIKGKVVKFINVGAFVEIIDGVEGLVHISEITEERIAKPSDVLQIGQNVNVKIIDINSKDKRISLSIKDAIERPKEDYSEYMDNNDTTLGELLGEKLKNFKLD